jgi:epoxide hydrolase-like predicted phosphatase
VPVQVRLAVPEIIMIKAILFDYGGVMTDVDRDSISARLAQILEIPDEDAKSYMQLGWGDYIRGQISGDTFWERIQNASETIVPPEYRTIWNEWDKMKPLPEMSELVSDLKARGLRVGLLSNVFPHTAIDIRNHGGYSMFDFTILSCDVGYAKPDKQIYDIAMSKLSGIDPKEVIFIDDQERCLVPARDMGIHTVLAFGPGQIRTRIIEIIESLK